MKILIGLIFITSFSWGRSVVPGRIERQMLDLYDKKNVVLPDGSIEVNVTTFALKKSSKQADLFEHGSKEIISKDEYDRITKTADAVLEMIRKQTGRNIEKESRKGTAFHIGESLVLTNHHVLDTNFKNKTSCDGFRLVNNAGEAFPCKKVHFCSSKQDDICLIEMAEAPVFKWFRKSKVSLSERPSVKLKAHYQPGENQYDSEIITAIGNTFGYGIHYSQGRGIQFRNNDQSLLFFAPVAGGNSGGPILNDEELVVGVVRGQSSLHVGEDTSLTYNVATPTDLVIRLIREALGNDPETLLKFNRSVVE